MINNEDIEVTLNRGEWNVVLACLCHLAHFKDAPHKDIENIVESISEAIDDTFKYDER